MFLLLASGVIAATSSAATPRSTGVVVGEWAAVLTMDAALVAAAVWMLLPPDATVLALVHEPQRQVSMAAVRRTASAAVVDVELGSALPPSPDRMTIALNGVPFGEIGSNTPGDRWMLATPASAWHIGANAIDVTGASPAAIGRIVVRPAR